MSLVAWSKSATALAYSPFLFHALPRRSKASADCGSRLIASLKSASALSCSGTLRPWFALGHQATTATRNVP
jgi:hypothetical protein